MVYVRSLSLSRAFRSQKVEFRIAEIRAVWQTENPEHAMPTYEEVSLSAYQTYMAQAPKLVAHWEHWSCPDAETYLSGVDYYQHPRECRLALRQKYPELRLGIPESDDPIPVPEVQVTGDQASHAVRWGDGNSWTFDWGDTFTSIDQVLAFSPLAQGDFRDIPVVESLDYRDEEALARMFRSRYPAEWGDTAPDSPDAVSGFYNTLFMWPLLTFGWENFLEIAYEPEFDRIIGEFAEINRRVFRSIAKLPVHTVVCHDDIVTTRGPVCSPAWMAKHIFPRYEEYWSMLHDAGKRVVFMVDGCMDQYVDDVFACGADGLVTEPYTDYKKIARKYPEKVLAGDGDNRVLSRNDPDEIRAMVMSMGETAKMCDGYFLAIGNHIPWNIPPTAVKLYLDLCRELVSR